MRLFIAVDIPREVKRSLLDISKEFEVSGIVSVKENALHITLQFLGDVEEKIFPDIKDALEKIKFGRFRADVKGISYFEPGFIKVIFAGIATGSEELKSLYKNLGVELSQIGLVYKKERSYKPHITIARVKKAKDQALILSKINKYSDFDFGSFEASSFILKSSVLTGDGPVYRDLYENKSRS